MTINLDFTMVINIIMIAGTIFLCISGYKNGFLYKLLSCISFIVIVFISWNLATFVKGIEIMPKAWSPFAETYLEPYVYGHLNQIFIFALLVLGFSLIILILKPIVKILGELPLIGTVNRMLGFVFGLVQSLIIAFVLTFLLSTPLFTNGVQIVQGSILMFVEPIQHNLFEVILPSLIDYEMINQFNEVKSEIDDVEALEKWLNEKGFSHEEIAEFMLRLTK